mmetsp:Transcript_15849/g.54117  ORF Transcript_15849/g.54117 Transcript_15849/m.54117 type:complete len:441 (+) Transcript_15849:1116-2438(+)
MPTEARSTTKFPFCTMVLITLCVILYPSGLLPSFRSCRCFAFFTSLSSDGPDSFVTRLDSRLKVRSTSLSVTASKRCFATSSLSPFHDKSRLVMPRLSLRLACTCCHGASVLPEPSLFHDRSRSVSTGLSEMRAAMQWRPSGDMLHLLMSSVLRLRFELSASMSGVMPCTPRPSHPASLSTVMLILGTWSSLPSALPPVTPMLRHWERSISWSVSRVCGAAMSPLTRPSTPPSRTLLSCRSSRVTWPCDMLYTSAGMSKPLMSELLSFSVSFCLLCAIRRCICLELSESACLVVITSSGSSVLYWCRAPVLSRSTFSNTWLRTAWCSHISDTWDATACTLAVMRVLRTALLSLRTLAFHASTAASPVRSPSLLSLVRAGARWFTCHRKAARPPSPPSRTMIGGFSVLPPPVSRLNVMLPTKRSLFLLAYLDIPAPARISR